MGVLMTCTYKSTYAKQTSTIEIIDTTGGSSANTFQSDDQGARIDMHGDTNDMFRRIYGTSCVFNLLLKESHHYDFANDLPFADEQKYVVIYYRDGVEYFRGHVLTDSVIQRHGYRQFLEVRAVDAIGQMKGFIYTNTTSEKYIERDTLLNHIFNCFDKTEIFDQYGGGEIVLITACNWFDNSHTSLNINPLDEMILSHSTFYKSGAVGFGDFFGEIFAGEFFNCYEVLEQILTVLNARIIYSKGVYHIETIGIRSDSSVKVFRYDKDRNEVSSSNVTRNKTIDNENIFIRRGGADTYLPALREVEVKFAKGFDINILRYFSWDPDDEDEKYITLFDVADDDVFIDGQIIIRYNTKKTSGDPLDFTNHRLKFNLTIRLFGGSNIYLKREATDDISSFLVGYESPTWESTAEVVEIYTPVVYPSNIDAEPPGFATYRVSISNIFSPVIAQGTYSMYLTLAFDGTVNENGSPVVLGGEYEIDWISDTSTFRILNKNTSGKESPEDYHSYTATNAGFYSKTREITTRFGDAPDTINWKKIQIDTGPSYIDSESWKVGAKGSDGVHISSLLAQEMVALAQKPVKRLNGSIFWTGSSYEINQDDRIICGSDIFLFMNGSIITRQDTIAGIWFFIARDTTSIALKDAEVFRIPIKDPYFPRDPEAQPDSKVGKIIEPPDSNNITSEKLDADTPITEINIHESVDYYFEGDVIQIVDQNLGNTYEFTLAQDLGIGDTIIYVIEKEIPEDLPSGTPIQNKGALGGGRPLYESSEDFGYTTNDYIDISDGQFGDPTVLSVKAMNRLVQVNYNGNEMHMIAPGDSFAEPEEANTREFKIEEAVPTEGYIRVRFAHNLKITAFIIVRYVLNQITE